MITVKVKYAAVTAMVRDLAAASGKPYEKILRLETASIIKICALRAKISSAAAIRRDVQLRAQHAFVASDHSLVTINSRKSAGRTWLVPGDKTPRRGPGGTFLMVYGGGRTTGHHLSAAAWQAYLLATNDLVGYVKARTAELMGRRGLMRLSWLQMADALGVPLSTVNPTGNLQEDIARNAHGPKGRVYANGSSVIRYTHTSLYILVTNASPLAIKRQGQQELNMAINRRVNAFQFAVAKGFFEDLKFRSSRWRGIFVTP